MSVMSVRTKWYIHDKYCISYHPDHNPGQRWGLRFKFNFHPFMLRESREAVEAFAHVHFELRRRHDFEHPRFENQLVLSNALQLKFDEKYPRPHQVQFQKNRKENESLSTWLHNRNREEL